MKIEECISTECASLRKTLEERNINLEKENQLLQEKLDEQREQHKLLINMNNNLQNLCSGETISLFANS